MQTIGTISVGTACQDDYRINQSGDSILCDKSR